MHRNVCILAAVLAAAAPSFGQEAGQAQFGNPPSPPCSNCLSAPSNTIYLDASGGKLMHPLPSSQRNFASASEFATFLQQNLNATPIYDSNGNIVGASGGLLQIGSTYYVDANNTVRPITDPISAFIGGIPAQFTVAGVTYSTGVQGQDYLVPQRTQSVPSDVAHCNSLGECLSEHSWNIHWWAHVRDSVGIEIDQDTGGYQESHSFCWKFGFIPWICTSSSGSNRLTLQGSLFWDPSLQTGTGPSYTALAYSTAPTQSNVTNITFSRWSICFGFGCAGASEASLLVGACEQGTSAAVPSLGATAEGRWLPQNCWGGGVTCNPGYSSCPGNYNICANLSNDAANCSACGHACPSGWVCASGVCSCAPGQTVCSGLCVNLSSDRNNCGACGYVCSGRQTCYSGVCQCPPHAACPRGTFWDPDSCLCTQ